jgi:single-strand DNA-binding protein
MIDINHVVLLGRLTRDAELKILSNGQAVCKFSIAVNRRKKNGDQWEDEASFFDIVLWGRSGETLNQYLVKGKQVAIDGELRQDRWTQDGQNRSKVEIVANNLQLLGGAGAGPGQGGGSQEPRREGGYSSRDASYHGSAGGDSSGGSQDGAPSYGAPQDGGFTDDVPF